MVPKADGFECDSSKFDSPEYDNDVYLKFIFNYCRLLLILENTLCSFINCSYELHSYS